MKDSQLTSLLSPLLTRLGLELESLDSVPAGKRRLLRIIVDGDGPQGRGPTLDEIADATRAISAALDETDMLGEQAYTLEVSSRGISRPLTEPKHWRRNTGRLVKVGLVGGGEVTGRVFAADDTAATLTVVTDPKRQTTSQQEVRFDQIDKALVQVEFVSAGQDTTDQQESSDDGARHEETEGED